VIAKELQPRRKKIHNSASMFPQTCDTLIPPLLIKIKTRKIKLNDVAIPEHDDIAEVD